MMRDILAGANRGFIGLNDDLCVGTGYDVEEGAYAASPIEWWDEETDGTLATPEQRVALADTMIERWARYRASALEAVMKGKKP